MIREYDEVSRRAGSSPLGEMARQQMRAADLRFTPVGMHADAKNLGFVASRFVQPAGSYRGRLHVGGRDLRLDGVLGVTEDQDTRW